MQMERGEEAERGRDRRLERETGRKMQRDREYLKINSENISPQL